MRRSAAPDLFSDVTDNAHYVSSSGIDVNRSIALVHVWTELIQSLWESARLRYLGAGDRTKLRRLEAEGLQAILRDRINTSGLVSVSMTLRHIGDD